MESIINKLVMSGTRKGRATAHALMIVRCPGKAGFFVKGIAREVVEGWAEAKPRKGAALRVTRRAILWIADHS